MAPLSNYPRCWCVLAAIASSPTDRGLVFVPRIPSLDFWLLDFTAKNTRQLTRFTNQGALRTFDVTPDGKNIVFDRSRQNSNIVLIDMPK